MTLRARRRTLWLFIDHRRCICLSSFKASGVIAAISPDGVRKEVHRANSKSGAPFTKITPKLVAEEGNTISR
jgi:hypothetical protein